MNNIKFEKNWIKILGLKSFIIVTIGKLFYNILNSLNYYNLHFPIKNEISELLNQNCTARSINNLICTSEFNGVQKYLLRPQTSDKMVFNQVIIQKEYSHLIDLIQFYEGQKTIKTIVDAGSNIGLTSLYFKKHYPKAHIISIEPDPSNYMHQIKNIKLNGFSESITIINKALWKNNIDLLSLTNNFRDGEYWSKSVEKNEGEENPVATIILSDVMNTYFQDELLDILKIDIEGSENVLFMDTNFVGSLKEKVKFVALEIHDELNGRTYINEILKVNNFSVHNIGETTFCINKNLVKCTC